MKTRSNSASPCVVTYKKRTYKKRKTKKTKEETIRIEIDTIVAEVIKARTDPVLASHREFIRFESAKLAAKKENLRIARVEEERREADREAKRLIVERRNEIRRLLESGEFGCSF